MAGAQIRRFLILHKALEADDGELTRTNKVRRGLHRRALQGAGRRALRRLAQHATSRSTSPSRTAARARSRATSRSATWRPSRSRRRHAAAEGELMPQRPHGWERATPVAHHRSWSSRMSATGVARSQQRRSDERPCALLQRGAAVGREHQPVVRRREGADRHQLRHHQGRDPRHHRPQRRRQVVDAELHQRLLSSAAGRDHLQGRAAQPDAAARGGRAGHRAAPSRTSRCSAACRPSTTS